MYIKFTSSIEWFIRDQARSQLQHELRKWATQHNLDYWSIELRERDHYQCIELPSTHAYELFGLTWNPQSELWSKYRLVRN